MKIGMAGSLESNDALITVKESSVINIEVQSIVDAFYHDQIVQVIQSTLDAARINAIDVVCLDKGALDYTIKARLLTAIHRMEVRHE
jgi:citrate lyase subunit gamma (acyl carrier protein)